MPNHCSLFIQLFSFFISRAVLHQSKSSYPLAPFFSLPRMQLWLEEMYSHPRGWLMSSLGRLRCALLRRWEKRDQMFFTSHVCSTGKMFPKLCVHVSVFRRVLAYLLSFLCPSGLHEQHFIRQWERRLLWDSCWGSGGRARLEWAEWSPQSHDQHPDHWPWDSGEEVRHFGYFLVSSNNCIIIFIIIIHIINMMNYIMSMWCSDIQSF